MVVGIFFVVVGGVFVFTMLMQIIAMFSYEWLLDGKDKYRVLKKFSVPLICFLLMVVFIAFVMPRIPEGM